MAWLPRGPDMSILALGPRVAALELLMPSAVPVLAAMIAVSSEVLVGVMTLVSRHPAVRLAMATMAIVTMHANGLGVESEEDEVPEGDHVASRHSPELELEARSVLLAGLCRARRCEDRDRESNDDQARREKGLGVSSLSALISIHASHHPKTSSSATGLFLCGFDG
jgi:hypothetical protein